MIPLVQRIRRIHALEHATMHLLPPAATRGRLMGRSDWAGFTLYGDLDTASLALAVGQALERLRAGERALAVHPNCGTNIAVGGLLAIGAAWVAISGKRRTGSRGLLAGLLLLLGIVGAQPLGLLAQAHLTTDPQVTHLRITGISRQVRHGIVEHRVRIGSD